MSRDTRTGSTVSSSGFKASQKTGSRLKVSSDRLGDVKRVNLMSYASICKCYMNERTSVNGRTFD